MGHAAGAARSLALLALLVVAHGQPANTTSTFTTTIPTTAAYGSYLIFRLTVLSNFGSTTHLQFSEVILLNNFTEVDLAGASASSDAPDCQSYERPEHAIDGAASTKWRVHPYNELAILLVQLPEATVVGGIRFTTGNDCPERDPKRFHLQGSNGDGVWDMLVDHSCSDATQVLARRQGTPAFTTQSAGCALPAIRPDNATAAELYGSHLSFRLTVLSNFGSFAFEAFTGVVIFMNVCIRRFS